MSEFLARIDWLEMWQGTLDTMLMMAGALPPSILLGLPLGIWLFFIGPKQLFENKHVYAWVSLIVNLLRSLPFIILVIALIDVTKHVLGESMGIVGALLPLVLGTSVFFARLVELALREVDKGVIEASQAMGAGTWQIIWHTLLPEAMPSLISATTVTAVALVSYTAMAGAVGAGGLGDLAIRYGYHRYDNEVMMITIVLMLILVQGLQFIGDKLVVHFSHK